MAKYSISGEFDAGWRSYWPPEADEQPSDESAESDTAADSQSKPNESMSDVNDWDGDLPEYATDPEQGEVTTVGEPNVSSSGVEVDVAFKLGRDTFHLLDDNGETYCTHINARPEAEDSALIRTHKSDAENAGLARCKQCKRISATGNKTREELIDDISEALPTPTHDSVTFSKVELAEILRAVEEVFG